MHLQEVSRFFEHMVVDLDFHLNIVLELTPENNNQVK